ncbi:hypothetical protein V1511DRAFT_200246 [Dipodascopsis uninucleata]
MTFRPLNNSAFSMRPKNRTAFLHHLIRDQFSITTWLLFGAAIQSTCFMLPIPRAYVIAPSIFYLSLKALSTLLITLNITTNTFLDGTLATKFTALIPNSDGTFASHSTPKEDDTRIAVLLLGFRVNHPLGILAPGAKETSDHFATMIESLESNSQTNGYLGSTSYLNASGSRPTKSELMITFYFRSLDHIHHFAHGPVHRDGWNWWNKTIKAHRHLSIMHEVYEAPKGKFENVFVNANPEGISATVYPIQDKDGKISWLSPIVDATKGQLASSAGRKSAYN